VYDREKEKGQQDDTLHGGKIRCGYLLTSKFMFVGMGYQLEILSTFNSIQKAIVNFNNRSDKQQPVRIAIARG